MFFQFKRWYFTFFWDFSHRSESYRSQSPCCRNTLRGVNTDRITSFFVGKLWTYGIARIIIGFTATIVFRVFFFLRLSIFFTVFVILTFWFFYNSFASSFNFFWLFLSFSCCFFFFFEFLFCLFNELTFFPAYNSNFPKSWWTLNFGFSMLASGVNTFRIQLT